MKLSIMLTVFFLLGSLTNASEKVVLPLKAIPQNLSLDHIIQVDQFRVISLLSDSLFEMGENLQLHPKLAESYRWEDGGRRLDVKIRKTFFSDGSPVKIEDVKKSILACVKSGRKGGLSSFSALKGYEKFINGNSRELGGVKVKGEVTLQFFLDKKTPLLTEALSNAACSILKASKGRDYYKGAIGAGPYKFVGKDKYEISLTKNKLYHGIKTGPKLVTLRSTSSYGDFNKLSKSFSLVITENKVKPSKTFAAFPYSRLGTWQLSFNNRKAPFSNPAIRKAVKNTIDFSLLQKELSYSPNRLQEGLFPFGMRGFKKRLNLKVQVDRANRSLAELGYSVKSPLEINFYLSKRKGSDKEAKVWEKAFKSRLVKVKVHLIEQKELVKIRNQGKFDILKHGKSPGSIDAHILLSSYHSKSRFNTPKANLPICDKKIVAALQVFDSDKRFEKYREVERCLLDQDIIVPLASLNAGAALVKAPWKITRTNQYLLYPYRANEWKKSK